jgi:hypothetical protein
VSEREEREEIEERQREKRDKRETDRDVFHCNPNDPNYPSNNSYKPSDPDTLVALVLPLVL